ncbi:protein smoothened-like isoform X2 [Bombyx mandarina]|uniref:Protein smoothened-like isoform X2 n=1 Tax=Bombyx mandarina TaxID=7092 RepID=A0A6J2KGL0_BOMMA|nr:protein smoothened-like isoform X2 [Bombyx mandarina]XP_028041488.1 protein smoothened-like isoform X2 [Bombyx mandarina]XP_028041489.1 protein smoothened-like isoform X2 [Bombyx mandarina]
MILTWTRWLLVLSSCRGSHFDSGSDKNLLVDLKENVTVHLEAINGTPIYRLIKPDESTQWFPERETKMNSCVMRARCEPLFNSTCLGSILPYSKTSVHLTFYNSQRQIQNQLEFYKNLINVPNCWAVIQPLLCATFMPKCEKILDHDMVYMPSFEMCKITMEPCAILYNTSYFPSFLKCNTTLFPPNCDNAMREVKFNTTGKCLPPLIHTDKSLRVYEGITGCGLPCRDPLYTEDEHQQIHKLVAWGAGVCLALNLLTVATFLIDWRSANKYPALVIFYINVCFAVASMGWLVQFGVGSRDDIVCSKDGTRRQGEPSAEENLFCVVVFVLVYYFMMAACVWFVIFTYAWHMCSFRALGKIQDRIDKKAAYFHLVAWSLPLILTITTMAFGEVDGSSVTGVCFVGYVNHPMRAALLLAPLAVVLTLGGYFLLRGVFSLVVVRVSSKDVISPRASNKIRRTITRCSITAALVAVFICVTFACHIYEFRNADLWKDSFKRNIICRLEAGQERQKECLTGSRPSISVLQLRLLCCFAAGALMSSWTWTPAALAAWRRYLARKCGCSVDEEITRRAQKHELIRRAYRRRAEFAARGRLSISLGGSRQDPVGLCLDHTSPIDYPEDAKHESGELSSSWAANLPRFVRRRDALVLPAHAHPHHSLSSTPDRRNSQDSQISISLRHVSVESRRNSLDSQLSVKIAEMKTKVGRRRTKHTKAKRKRATGPRKESTPSIESQISRYWLQAVAANNDRSREEVKFSFE